jgi:hypothetical protein
LSRQSPSVVHTSIFSLLSSCSPSCSSRTVEPSTPNRNPNTSQAGRTSKRERQGSKSFCRAVAASWASRTR